MGITVIVPNVGQTHNTYCLKDRGNLKKMLKFEILNINLRIKIQEL